MIYFCECKIYVKNMLPETDFINRHIGPRKHQVKQMLLELGVQNIKELIDKTIPQNIQLDQELDVGEPMSETRYLEHIQKIGQKIKYIEVILV